MKTNENISEISEPLFCDKCDFYSNTKRGLKTHITRKHNNKNNTLTVKEQESFDTFKDTDKEECNISNEDETYTSVSSFTLISKVFDTFLGGLVYGWIDGWLGGLEL